jgi:hypothetical protein
MALPHDKKRGPHEAGPFPCDVVLAAGNDRAFAERRLADRGFADRGLSDDRRRSRRRFHVHVGRGGDAGETEDCHSGKNESLHEEPPRMSHKIRFVSNNKLTLKPRTN